MSTWRRFFTGSNNTKSNSIDKSVTPPPISHANSKESLNALTSMGFDYTSSKNALAICDGDVNSASNYLLNQAKNLPNNISNTSNYSYSNNYEETDDTLVQIMNMGLTFDEAFAAMQPSHLSESDIDNTDNNQQILNNIHANTFDKLNNCLITYYKLCNDNSYFSQDKRGKFLAFIETNGLNESDMKHQFEMNANNCIYCEFDQEFPLNPPIYNKQKRLEQIYKILLYSYKYNRPYINSIHMEINVSTLSLQLSNQYNNMDVNELIELLQIICCGTNSITHEIEYTKGIGGIMNPSIQRISHTHKLPLKYSLAQPISIDMLEDNTNEIKMAQMYNLLDLKTALQELNMSMTEYDKIILQINDTKNNSVDMA
eukprot:555123_1